MRGLNTFRFWQEIPMEGGQTYSHFIIEKLSTLEAAGITHSDVERVRELLKTK